MRFHWNRQFDQFTNSLFIIGDELPAALETSGRVSTYTYVSQ